MLPQAENQTSPPEQIAPPLAARALSFFRLQDAFHLTAIPFDLAQRGYLTIEQQENDVIFSRTDKSAVKLTHLFERLFLTDMFGPTGHMPFQQLAPRIYQMRRSLDTQIAQALRLLKKIDKAAWRGFKRYLSLESRAEDPSKFGRYLAYAIAFNVDLKWATRFVHLPEAAMPHWYSTPEPSHCLIEILRIVHTMSHQLKTASQGVSIPFDAQLAASAQHPLGQGVLIITTPASN